MEKYNKKMIKRGLSSVLLSSGILIGASFTSDIPFSSIEVAAATTTTYKTTAPLNLRTSNSLSAKVLLTIPQGKAVTYISKSGNWYKVKYSGKTGWVSSSYIKVTKTTSAASTTKTTYATTASLVLRSTNSNTGKALLTIPKGKAVTYVSKSGKWFKVKYNGKTGWVSSSYIKVSTTSTTAKAASTTKANTTTKTTYTTTEALNLRSTNSTSGKVLLTIPKGKAVTYISKSGNWFKVSYGGKTGWVSSSYIKVSNTSTTSKTTNTTKTNSPSKTTPNKTDTKKDTTNKTDNDNTNKTDTKTDTTNKAIYTTTTNLNLRDTNSTSGNVLLVIPSGKAVTYISTSGDWYKVKYDGKTGWVSSSFIKVSTNTSSNAGTTTNLPAGQTISSMVVYSGKSKLYASNSATSLLTDIPANTKLTTNYKTTNGWYKVTYSGKTGFVSGSDLISETEKARINNLEKNKNSYLFMDLRTVSSVTAAQINTYIKNNVGNRPSVLLNSGKYFVDAGKKYGVNALYLAAHAIHESGFGTSQISLDRYNLFGYGAYDLVPYIGSVKFESIKNNIEFIAQKMKATYLGNSWLNQGNYLGYSAKSIAGGRIDSLSKGMNFYYATDGNWGNAIASHMTRILDYSKEGATKKSPNTTVYSSPSYPNLSDVFPTKTLAVANSTLYLYSSKSTNNYSVGTIPKGEKFNLLEKDNNYWLTVKYKNKIYYVPASSYFHEYKYYFTVKNLLRVTTNGLNVRDKATTTNSNVIAVVNNKDYLELVLNSNNVPIIDNGWYNVVINGKKGWVLGTYVTRELNR